MPSRNQSGKPEHVFQNKNRKRKKTGKKNENLLKHWARLLKREEKEGLTKWIAHAKGMAAAKMKKYGLHPAK